MGDRARIVFTDGTDSSPIIYLHWMGSYVPELLIETCKLMEPRGPDVDYTAARFIGIAHSRNPDSYLSLGVSNLEDRPTPAETRAMIMDEPFSPGDAGVFLVDVRTWEAENYCGYGFDLNIERPRGGTQRATITPTGFTILSPEEATA